MNECVKTITLDEEPYARLKAWKRDGRDSFSQVVKRVVPEPGTLGAILGFVERHGTHRLPGNEVLEECVNRRRAPGPGAAVIRGDLR